MDYAKRDRRITLQEATVTRNGYGEEVNSYGAGIEVWANINEKQASKEAFEAGRETATRQAIFNIRWRSGVTEKTRIIYNGLNYDITTLAEIGRRKELEIRAEAKV